MKGERAGSSQAPESRESGSSKSTTDGSSKSSGSSKAAASGGSRLPRAHTYTNPYAVRLDASNTEAERDEIVRDFKKAPPHERAAARDDFIEYLRDDRDTRDHNNVRSYAAVFLGVIGGDDIYEYLVERMYAEENDVVLKWIVKVVVERFDHEDRFEHLFNKYRKEKGGIIFARQIIVGAVVDAADRARKVEGDGVTKDEIGPFGRKILLEAISDLYWEIRVPAIRALGEMKERSAVQPLIRFLKDPPKGAADGDTRIDRAVSSSERALIIDALARIGDPMAVDVVLDVLDRGGDGGPVARAAVEALGHLGRELDRSERDEEKESAIVVALIERICHPDRMVGYTATYALQKVLGEESAARRLAHHGLRCDKVHLDSVTDAIRLLDPVAAVSYLQWLRDEVKGGSLPGPGEEKDGRRPAKTTGGADANPHERVEELGNEERTELEDRIRKLIAHIGGSYALEALSGDDISPTTQFVVRFLIGALLVASLSFGAYVLLNFLRPTLTVGKISASADMALAVIAALISLFLASILVAFPANKVISRLRYLTSILLAFLFSVGMVATLSMGLWWLNEADSASGGRLGEALAYGPLTVHRHVLADGHGTWFVSLSAALPPRSPKGLAAAGAAVPTDPEAGQEVDGSGVTGDTTLPVAAVTTDTNAAADDGEAEGGGTGHLGFSAPLWVLLLATIGAGLLTVSLIVKELSDRPHFSDQEEMRDRLGQVIQHQFFILFAPFGAIFVYQGLVAIGAHNELLTVAVAALGAGASLNILLERAVRSSRDALKRGETGSRPA